MELIPVNNDEKEEGLTSNRINIFRKVAVNEIDNSVNETIFEHLLSDQYPRFVEACEYVKSHPNPEIQNVSCYLEQGQATFVFETSSGDITLDPTKA
jgi:hypothetical protein